jgi:hypothetical protein
MHFVWLPLKNFNALIIIKIGGKCAQATPPLILQIFHIKLSNNMFKKILIFYEFEKLFYLYLILQCFRFLPNFICFILLYLHVMMRVKKLIAFEKHEKIELLEFLLE